MNDTLTAAGIVDVLKETAEQRRGLDDRVGQLYREGFHREFPVREYHDWYQNFPEQRMPVFALRDDDRCVAYNYFWPQRLVNGHLSGKNVFLSGGSVAAKGWGQAFIFFYKRLQSEFLRNDGVLIAFCNAQSYPLFTSPLLGWREIKPYRQHTIPVGKNDGSGRPGFRSLPDLSRVSSTLSPLASLRRDPAWLAWRLAKPGTRYCFLEDIDSGALVIYKEFADTVDLLSIVNIDSLDGYLDVLGRFQRFIAGRFDVRRINLISSSAPLNQEIERRWQSGLDLYERHLCVRSAKSEEGDVPDLFLEMIDSDVY